MSLEDTTRHTGKHAKVKAARPAGLVVKTKDSDAEFEEEVERVKSLIIQIVAGLERCEERVDASLSSIDRTLQTLVSQKARIQVLERELGIER